jgi:hypothetical protein
LALNCWAQVYEAPILDYDSIDEKKELEALGPFFFWQAKEPEFKTYGFRPIFSYKRAKDTIAWDVFYPLIRYRRDEIGPRFHFLLFSRSTTNYKEFFPIFWGKTESGEKYGGFFPVYGTFKERFGKDEIKFVLWPFYLTSRKGELYTYRYLWPFFTKRKGPGRKSFKFLPFYGYDHKEGQFNKYYVLWPIFISQKTKLDTPNPRSYFHFFPFYISESSPVMDSHTYLWPFFRTYRYRDYRHYDFPWPILSLSKGEGIDEFKFLPFYGYEKTPNKKSTYLLYPIYKHQIEERKDEKIVTDFFFFIDYYERRYDDKGNITIKLAKLWPFYYYKEQKEQVKASFPFIFPIADEGFERNLAPIFRLYYHERNHKKSYTKWFWGLYYHKKTQEKEVYHLFPLFNWERGEEEKKLSLLTGILQIGTLKKKHYVKLLYFFRLEPSLLFDKYHF